MEYALNVRSADGRFVRQIDVFETGELAKEYADQHPEDFTEGFAEIVCIEYDENGDEYDSYAIMWGRETA